MLINVSALSEQQILSRSIFFIFGNDEGLVEFARNKVLSTHKIASDNTALHTFKDAKSTLSSVIAAATSPSLFGGDKAVVISEVAGNFSESFFDSFKAQPGVVYVFKAGSTKKTSKLYKYFTESRKQDVCTIQCYALDAKGINQFITSYLAKHGKKIAPQVCYYLAGMMPSNVMIIERELEKLDLFTADKAEVSHEDIDELFTDLSAQSADDILYNIVKDPKKSCSLIAKVLDESSEVKDVMLLFRSLLNTLKRLIQVKVDIKNGGSTVTAIQALKPPLFFKFRQQFMDLLQITNIPYLKRLLRDISALEYQIKNSLHKDINKLVMQHFLTLPAA